MFQVDLVALEAVAVRHLLVDQETHLPLLLMAVTAHQPHQDKVIMAAHLLALERLILDQAVGVEHLLWAGLAHLLLAVTEAQELHLLFLGHLHPTLVVVVGLLLMVVLQEQVGQVVGAMLATMQMEHLALQTRVVVVVLAAQQVCQAFQIEQVEQAAQASSS